MIHYKAIAIIVFIVVVTDALKLLSIILISKMIINSKRNIFLEQVLDL